MKRNSGNLQLAILLAMAILATLSGIVTAMAYLIAMREESAQSAPQNPQEPGPQDSETPPEDHGGSDPTSNPGMVQVPSNDKLAGGTQATKPPTSHRSSDTAGAQAPVRPTPKDAVVLDLNDPSAQVRVCPDCGKDLEDTIHAQYHYAVMEGEMAPTTGPPPETNPPPEPVEIDAPSAPPPPLEGQRDRGFAQDRYPIVDLMASWDEFRARYGGRIEKFGDVGQPAGIQGCAVPTSGAAGAGGPPDYVVAARGFLAAHQQLLRVHPDNLQALVVADLPGGKRVTFGQVYRGMPVLDTTSGQQNGVRVDLDDQGTVRGYDSDYAPGLELNPRPTHDASELLDQVMSSAENQFPDESFQVRLQELAVLATWNEDRVTGTLVWRFLLSGAQGLNFQSYMDAHAGTLYAERWWQAGQ